VFYSEAVPIGRGCCTMAMIVTLKSVNDGFYTVSIKREIGAGKETREFTKAALNEYLESVKNAGKEMTCRFFLEDWFDGTEKNIAAVVYWNDEVVELYRF
jgi:hypothetical protein